jgi:hypothetical protein
MTTPAKIHHFGLVVPSIETYLQQSSMWELRSPIVEDPLQKARLCMIGLVDDASPAIVELVQPLGDDSPTSRAASKGVGCHHVCLSVATAAAGDAMIAQHRLLPVTRWKPAALFSGRPVRFVYSRNRELIELISDDTSC